MKIAVPTEQSPDDPRVALVPAVVPQLAKAGFTVRIQAGAGLAAGYPDSQYQAKGAEIVTDRAALLADADIVAQVATYPFDPAGGEADLDQLHSGQVVLGMANPLVNYAAVTNLAERGVTGFAMELVPRITRAQSMDALSSMASIAGYKAVLLAAARLPKMFPLMMTAAGTIKPARVFVVGAGVAGLQAIATAKRLGAVVRAYDVRPAVKEQCESVGAKFVELDLKTEDAEDAGGYARAQSDDFLRRQRELMKSVVTESDVVITTAAIPGKPAPVLITEEMVAAMPPGSVIVDLAAASGGNCELTDGEETVTHGVTILGPANLAATLPYHASQMYAKNLVSLLLHLAPKGELTVDPSDEITSATLLCRDGQVVNPRLRDLLGLTEPVAVHGAA